MLTRRDVLQKCIALGSVLIAPTVSPEGMLAAFQDHEKQIRKPTAPNTLGPFYKRLVPVNDVLRAPGDPGIPLTLSGQVFDTRGDIVTDTTIEIWQTNHQGYYDVDGYRYRGKRQVDKSGAYTFESVIPGHYPTKVASANTSTIWSWRPTLVTQLLSIAKMLSGWNPFEISDIQDVQLSRPRM
jgi:protocatechuate 3,4-dioxygenase beta subunit